MLADAALKIRDAKPNQHGITSVAVDVTLGDATSSIEYRVWSECQSFRSNDLDAVVAEAIAYTPKQAKLREAAELRAKAAQLEQEAA